MNETQDNNLAPEYNELDYQIKRVYNKKFINKYYYNNYLIIIIMSVDVALSSLPAK